MKVLILSHFYPPEIGAAAARIHGLARWLCTFGHDVTVITGMPNYPTGKVLTAYKGKMFVWERLDGVKILHTWIFATSHHSGFKRLLNYFSFFVLSIISGVYIRQKHYDVILASSPPLFVGLSGMFLSQLLKIPFVYDVRDLWPDIAVETGVYNSKDFIIRIGKMLAHYLYHKADHITPVTEYKRDRIVSVGILKRKLTIVTNGVDFDRLDISDNNVWQKNLKLHGKFIIAYTGLIGIAQGVDIIVQAAHLLKDNNGIFFLIVGDGVEREKLITMSKELNLQNIAFLHSQPREVVPSIMAVVDVALVPLVSKKLVDAVPSKLMEAWACHKPVILVAGGEAAKLVNLAQGGVVVPPQLPYSLAEIIESMKSDPNLLKSYASNGYSFVRKYFNRKDLAEIMENVLIDVITTGKL